MVYESVSLPLPLSNFLISSLHHQSVIDGIILRKLFFINVWRLFQNAINLDCRSFDNQSPATTRSSVTSPTTKADDAYSTMSTPPFRPIENEFNESSLMSELMAADENGVCLISSNIHTLSSWYSIDCTVRPLYSLHVLISVYPLTFHPLIRK